MASQPTSSRWPTSDGVCFPTMSLTKPWGFHCRAGDNLEEERLARINAEDMVVPLIISVSNWACIAGQEMT